MLCHSMPRHLPNFSIYGVLELISRGGMGSVYRGYDARHQRAVAVKLLDPIVTDATSSDRFLEEIRIAANLNHPHILPIFDSGESEGRLFYVMPLVEGPTLADRIAEGPLPPSEVCRIGGLLGNALQHAHSRGVLHRDIKPANILLADGEPVIADFGLARALDRPGDAGMTAVDGVVGTPRYMSPEQATGNRPLDGRCDIYSLGLTLLEALTGGGEVGAGGPAVTEAAADVSVRRAAHGPLGRAGPRRLRRVLLRATALDPDRRYRSAADFARALRRCEQERATRPVVYAATAAVLLAIAAGAGTLAHLRSSIPQLSGTRVAVATIENQTGRPELDAVGVMTADWITQGLQRSDAFQVLPTAAVRSAERYVAGVLEAGGGLDPVRELALATGAGLVVSGALFPHGDSIRIQLQLTDVRQGTVVGGLEPIIASAESPLTALDEARSRVITLVARHLDARVADAPGASAQPPIFEAYRHFTEGMDAYSRTAWEEARGHFESARLSDSAFIQALLFEGLSLSNMGRFAEAAERLESVDRRRAELSDHDRDWLDYRIAALQGDEERALRAIRRAANRAPASKASYNLAVAAMEQGRMHEAMKALESLEANRGAMHGFVPYLATVASLQHLLGRHREELRTARKMQEIHPGEPWGAALEIYALAALGRERAVLQRLEAYALEAPLGGFSGFLSTARQVADELRAHGRGPPADSVVARALRHASAAAGEIDSSPALRMELLQLLHRAGRWAEARALLTELRGEDPADVELLTMDAVIAARTGDSLRLAALRDTLAAIDKPFLFGAPHYGLARVAVAAGDQELALRHLRAARAAARPIGPRSHREYDLFQLRHDNDFLRIMEPWRAAAPPSGR
jgi:tetratricopeptide (TPR) repeat protein/TolB-like protein